LSVYYCNSNLNIVRHIKSSGLENTNNNALDE
jgi:hypothetical protein